MASRRLLLVAAAVAAVASVAAHTTGASFSAGTSNSANTFSAASSWGGCPSTAPATDWISGFEVGKVFGGHATGIALGANTNNVNVTTTRARHGAYGLRVNATGVSTHAQRLFITPGTVAVVRFAVRFDTLPVEDVEMFRVGAAAAPHLSFGYRTTSNAFALRFTGSTPVESSVAVATGQWYVVDLRLDMSSGLWSGDWRVNGVPGTSRTHAGAPSNLYSMWIGTTETDDFLAYYDDVAVARSAADYPLGNGKVLSLKPTGMGTSSNPGDFEHGDGSPIGPTTYQLLDEIPMAGSGDYVEQAFAGAGSYVELRNQQTAETCIRMVQGAQMNNMGSSNQNNHGKASIVDGAAERVIYNGSMVAQASNQEYIHVAAVPPAGAAWTQTALNNIVWRIGYSTDVSPTPRWDALLVEYEVAL